MALDLLIRDVRAITPRGVVHADIEVAGGREVFPGAIDPHVHFRGFPTVGGEGDGFADVAEAAVRGGITSYLGFVIAPPEMPAVEAVRSVIAHQGSVPVDFGLHYVLWPRPDRLDEIPALCGLGVRSYKLFFAYPERGFMFEGPVALDAFERIRRAGGLALAHAEDGHTIKWIEDRARDRLGASATIQDYLASRPERLEAAGVELVALWSVLTGCPLYLVHLSTGAAVPALRAMLAAGADITVETCPHYLVLDQRRVEALGPLGKFAPAARTERDNAALWEAIASGLISTIGSDHAGHVRQVKLEMGAEHGIFGVPFGIPGIETSFPLMYTHGVVAGPSPASSSPRSQRRTRPGGSAGSPEKGSSSRERTRMSCWWIRTSNARCMLPSFEAGQPTHRTTAWRSEGGRRSSSGEGRWCTRGWTCMPAGGGSSRPILHRRGQRGGHHEATDVGRVP